MKRLIFFTGFLLLTMFLFEFNYGYSQKNDFEEAIKEKIIKVCKEYCRIYNSPKFCKRICEVEISDPRWIFLGFDSSGSARFYDSKSLSTSDNIVKVWVKIIYSERAKQEYIKEKGRKYENLDLSLDLLEIDCTKKIFQILSFIYYASDGSVIDSYDYPEFLADWNPIPPDSMIEALFKKICQVKE
ncbi:MAG: hypothetical protein H0Z16_06455 [Thermodesulfobacterium sp.]|nr:hypothetical protein [Thermodesulfobacterium sp.]